MAEFENERLKATRQNALYIRLQDKVCPTVGFTITPADLRALADHFKPVDPVPTEGYDVIKGGEK